MLSIQKYQIGQTFPIGRLLRRLMGFRLPRFHTAAPMILLILFGILFAAQRTNAQMPSTSIFQAFIPPMPIASVGDTVNVPIVLRALNQTARQRFITNVEFFFRFNPRVAYLLDTSLARLAYYADNNMVVSIRRGINRRLRANEDTILQIPIRILWGDAKHSELKIGADRNDPGYTFQVFDSAGFQNALVQNGSLTIRDVSWGDSLLTINAGGNPLRMMLGPNPVPDNVLNFQLSIGNLDPQPFSIPTLVLYFLTGDRAGEDAIDLTPQLVPLFRTRTTEMLRVNLNMQPVMQRLPRGVYLCRFAYSIYAVSRLVVVQ